MEYGLKEGINKTIKDAISLGKNTLGIFKGEFNDISQIKSIIKNGKILDNLSNIIDASIDKMAQNGKIKEDLANIIKYGKKTILDNIESNLDKSILNQQEKVYKLENYIENWEKYYDLKDFNGMEKEFKKINKVISELIPIENIIKRIRNLENLHTLVKTNGKNFNLTEIEQELLKKMA